MSGQKRILMFVLQKQVEALRMASGLTLLDDVVSIVTWGALPESDAVAEQMEALEFSEVPVLQLDPAGDAMAALARQIINSDVVYCV